MLIRAIALLLMMGAAQADPARCTTCTYLIAVDQATALARSQQQCAALACDGVLTRYWWNVIGPLNAGMAGATPVPMGAYAIEVQATGPFSATTVVNVKSAGLTAQEQSTLATAIQLAPLVPVVAVVGQVQAPP